MGDLRNEFSWSKSRAKAFTECARRYWLHYYGSWAGWERGAPPETRQAYLLKKVASRHQWVGQEVHERIRICLKMLKAGQTPVLATQMEALVETMRRRYKDSRRGDWVANPSKILRLFEHEYELPVPDTEWVRLREHAKDCLRGFFESPYYELARTLPPERWLSVEDMDQFLLDGTPIWVALDFSFRREDGGATIVDWKTGQRDDPGSHRLQMHIYALHAAGKWGFPLDKIRIVAWALASQHGDEVVAKPEELEASKAEILASIAAMRDRLVDRDAARNVAEQDAFPKTEDTRRCRYCAFQRICWPDGLPDGAARDPAPGAEE